MTGVFRVVSSRPGCSLWLFMTRPREFPRRFASDVRRFESKLPANAHNVVSPFDNPLRRPATVRRAGEADELQVTAPAESARDSPPHDVPSRLPVEKPLVTDRPEQGLEVNARDNVVEGRGLQTSPDSPSPPRISPFARNWRRLEDLLRIPRIPAGASDDEKKRFKFERNTAYGLRVLGGLFLLGGIFFFWEYGLAKRDKKGMVIVDEHSGKWLAWFYRMASAVHAWRQYVVEPSRELLLPDPLPAPYHQPKYTVVVEMRNVLIAPEWTYKTGHRFLKRPAVDYFLDVVGYPNFELVIYTSESGMSAPPIVESLDPKGKVMYKLYRDCTKYVNGHHVKDLARLNRDLKHVILIDFDPKSFQLNPENVLRVPKWEGNMEDTGLVDLAELLKTIHLSDVDDVRPLLQYYSQFDDPAKEFRRRAIFLQEQEEKRSQDQQNFVKRYAGRLFGFRRHQSG